MTATLVRSGKIEGALSLRAGLLHPTSQQISLAKPCSQPRGVRLPSIRGGLLDRQLKER